MREFIFSHKGLINTEDIKMLIQGKYPGSNAPVLLPENVIVSTKLGEQTLTFNVEDKQHPEMWIQIIVGIDELRILLQRHK